MSFQSFCRENYLAIKYWVTVHTTITVFLCVSYFYVWIDKLGKNVNRQTRNSQKIFKYIDGICN